MSDRCYNVILYKMPQFVSRLTKRTPLWGHRSLNICQKNCFLIDFSPTKLLAISTHKIYSISFIFMDVEYHEWFGLESPFVVRKYVFTRLNAEKDRSLTAFVACITSISFLRIQRL